ncbi:hypothetical protein C0989_003329 [Termitomyces sp. Mn162]|nr:hypothetical protein C0989_003329 [Termitomyces sp. Mn162]
MATTTAAPRPRPRRIPDALDAIKQEPFVRRSPSAVAHQVGEVSSIRRSLYDLEVQQAKVRQHYEDELRRLRLELAALRHAAPPQGIPGFQPVPDADKRPKPERETSPHDVEALYPPRPHPSDYQLPPINTSSFPDELTVPPDFRKDGSDWFAVFNPRIKRSLDISLVHNLPHASVVCCVQFSLDGKYLATGCNRTAQIYDVKSGAKICVLADETAGKSGDLYIRSVRFSPDGKLLATGAEDRQIRIWDIAKKRIRNIFSGHTQEIYSLDFSLDGRFIISGSGDKTARVWDMHDESVKVLTISDTDSLNNDAGVTSVAISPSGALVAAGSLDTIVRIWDVKTGALVERLRGHRDSVYSVAFTPDGRGLVSGSLDKTLKYWDVAALAARKEEKKLADKGASVCTMDFVGHKVGRMCIFLTSVDGGQDYVLSVAVSHDGQWVVSGSKDRCVQFWDIRNATLQFVLQGHKNSGTLRCVALSLHYTNMRVVISLDVNPIGNMLATGSGDSLARICKWLQNSHSVSDI